MRRTSVLYFRFCIAFAMRKWFNRFTNALKSLSFGDNTDMLLYNSNYHRRNILYLNRLFWVTLWDYIYRMKTKYMVFCIHKNDISMPIAERKSKLQYFGIEYVTSTILKTLPNPHGFFFLNEMSYNKYMRGTRSLILTNWEESQKALIRSTTRSINDEYQKNKLSQIAYDMKSSAWFGKHNTAFNNGKITTLSIKGFLSTPLSNRTIGGSMKWIASSLWCVTTLNIFPKWLIDYAYPRLPTL